MNLEDFEDFEDLEEPKEVWTASHFNNNRAVAVAIKTTGSDPYFHELVQICIYPLNSKFELSKEIIPFYCDIKPLKPKLNLQLNKGFLALDKYIEIKNMAMMPQAVADLFDDWMENKIRLINGKKLLVLAHNWCWVKQFIEGWLGPVNFNYYFHHEYRDIQTAALYCNDYSDIHALQFPYNKAGLSFIANIMRVEYNKNDDAILHCKTISEVYRGMIHKFQPSLDEEYLKEDS